MADLSLESEGARYYRRAFTLVELLVVLAIIAVLTGLLFPVFGAARERSRKATCVSNLRQLYSALSLYVTDHDGLLPPYRSQLDSKRPSNPAGLKAAVNPYLKSNAVWFCPSDAFAGNSTPQYSDTTGSVDHEFTSYWTSVKWTAWTLAVEDKLPSRNPPELSSDTQLLTDNIWLNAVATATYSHSGKFNHLWGDGSVHEPAQSVPK